MASSLEALFNYKHLMWCDELLVKVFFRLSITGYGQTDRKLGREGDRRTNYQTSNFI